MSRSRPATAAEAQRFHAYMETFFHARIVRRQEASEYQIIRHIIEDVGIADIEDFFRDYSFTVGPLIYLKDGLAPDQEISIITHECQHVHQFHEGKLKFAWLYLTEGEYRAKMEVDAYSAQWELKVARGYPLPSVNDMVFPLEAPAYMLKDDEQAFARTLFGSKLATLGAGIIASTAGKTAVSFLKKNLPDLLAVA